MIETRIDAHNRIQAVLTEDQRDQIKQMRQMRCRMMGQGGMTQGGMMHGGMMGHGTMMRGQDSMPSATPSE